MTVDLTSSLHTYFGFTGFHPGQREAIQSLLDGKHTLVVMPTGSGKSLVFQLAALHLHGVTLVISPLIALMKDQVDSLERRGIPATFINSTLPANEQNRRLKGLSSGSYRIVYIAPERLRSTQFLGALQGQKVALLAVDEAHCISEWGHDFRPDYLHIAQFRATLGDPLTAALTATATPQVQDDIARLLGLPQVERVVTGFNRPNLALEVRYLSSPVDRLKALQALLAEHEDGASPHGATIIYTGTRRDAEEAAEFVSSVVGLEAQHYHAGLPAEDRTRIQDAFMTGGLCVVAATNAFGMGIDRPDVRQVIHYALPGSLEAYYQEAGRAGRDGLPARAVLLYSPDDRALQEWFIENSVLSIEDLRQIYNALIPISKQQKSITIEALSGLTGLQEVQARLGLAELERAEAVEHLGDDGTRMRIRVGDWKIAPIRAAIQRQQQRQAYRKAQLDHMIAYAESNTCRRRMLLNHFGDSGSAEAEVCCDNCQARQAGPAPAKEMGALTQSERVALIVLDTVHRLHQAVGREKIGQILKGSKAQDMRRFGYDKHIYYGRLAVYSGDEIKAIIDQLLEKHYFKVVGGKYPVLHLTPQGEAAIRDKSTIPLKLPRAIDPQKIASKKAERQAGGTIEYTGQLFAEGLSVAQIAERRGLSAVTIYGHAARLIAAGKLAIDGVISQDVQMKIEAAIEKVGNVDFLYPIKNLLPEEIDYNVIRCVVENWKRARTANMGKGADVSAEDLVAAFLARPHPRPLPGTWEAGWALGFHSQFTGADWKRSGAGELAYRLKYQDDLSVLPQLVEQAVALIASHPELAQVDAVVPTPPSIAHLHDPVSGFAEALSQRLGLAFTPVLIKSRQTSPQKELHTLAQKRQNVADAFALKAPLAGKRVLIVDDLFDSGATLEEITRILRRSGAGKICVLTMTRTIHSDA